MTNLEDSTTLNTSDNIKDIHMDSVDDSCITVHGSNKNNDNINDNEQSNLVKNSESQQDDIIKYENSDLLQLENVLFNQYILDPTNIKTPLSSKSDTVVSNFDGAMTTPSDLVNFEIQNQNNSIHNDKNNNNKLIDDKIFHEYIYSDNIDISPSNNNNSNSVHQFIPPMATTIATSNTNNYQVDENGTNIDKSTSSVRLLTEENNTFTSTNKEVLNEISQSDHKSVPNLMEQKFKTLIDETLTFGRTKEITSRFIDPTNYLNLDESTLAYKLTLQGLPQVTRVENQLKLSLILSPLISDKYLIYLPIDSITRERFYLSNDIITYPKSLQEQLLYLDAFVLDKVTNKNIEVCMKCVNREQRRASRRKSKISDNLLWCNNKNRRAIIFNNKQISLIEQIDSNHKKIELTTRIVCYCRHHKSEEGFKLLFVIKDFMGNVLAKTISDPIIITDRKQQILELATNKENNKTNTSNISMVNDIPTLSNSLPYESHVDIPTNINSTVDPSSTINENSTSNSTTPSHHFDNVDHPLQLVNQFGNPDHNLSTPQQTQNFINLYQTQQNFAYSQPGQLNRNYNINHDPSGKKIIPSPTSMSEDGSETIVTELLYNKNSNPSANSLTSLNDIHGGSRKRSRVSIPSVANPSNLRRQYSVNLQNNLHSMSDFTLQQQQQLQQLNLQMSNNPSIQRVIPSKGPISGGIEVTLLGARFKQGLIVKFGNNIALSTQCWSETTILTYLPPAMSPGQVFVTLYDPNNPDNDESNNNINVSDGMSMNSIIHPSQKAIFTYIDESDRQLIELALQIVGLKMNGKLEDAKNIAKKIVDDDNRNSPANQNQSVNGTNMNNYSTLNDSAIVENDEQLIIKVIQSLNKTTCNLSMCDTEGRTLLHLAALKGYLKLSTVLIKAGAHVDDRDKFGFTPLHFAAISGNYKVIRLLLTCQSNPLALTNNGMTVRKLYEDNHMFDSEYDNVIDILEYYMDSSVPSITRKISQTSFDSNISAGYSELSLNVTNEFEEREHMKVDDFNRSNIISDVDQSYEEYEEEFSFSGESELIYSSDYDEVSEANMSESFDISEESSTANTESFNPSISGTFDVDVSVSNTSEIPNDNDNTNTDTNDGSMSAWNRLLTRINEDLPKYEDLYPRNWINSKAKDTAETVTEDSNIVTRTRRTSETMSITSQMTSEDDEDDAIQKIFNQFFQTNRLAMHKDKMLFFFWLPVMVLLLVWVLWLQFNQDDNSMISKVNGLVQHYVAMGLAKIVLGNQRMRTVFRNSFNNLHTSGILNDLIVG